MERPQTLALSNTCEIKMREQHMASCVVAIDPPDFSLSHLSISYITRFELIIKSHLSFLAPPIHNSSRSPKSCPPLFLPSPPTLIALEGGQCRESKKAEDKDHKETYTPSFKTKINLVFSQTCSNRTSADTSQPLPQFSLTHHPGPPLCAPRSRRTSPYS